MRSTAIPASGSLPAPKAKSQPKSQPQRTHRPEEFAYQAVTLAAILLVLGSICLF